MSNLTELNKISLLYNVRNFSTVCQWIKAHLTKIHYWSEVMNSYFQPEVGYCDVHNNHDEESLKPAAWHVSIHLLTTLLFHRRNVTYLISRQLIFEFFHLGLCVMHNALSWIHSFNNILFNTYGNMTRNGSYKNKCTQHITWAYAK